MMVMLDLKNLSENLGRFYKKYPLASWGILIVASLIIIILLFPTLPGTNQTSKLPSLNRPLNLPPLIKKTTTTLPSISQGLYADLCHYLAMFNLTELSWNNVTCEYNSSTHYCRCMHVIS